MPNKTKKNKQRFTRKRGGNDDPDETENDGFYTPAGSPSRSRSNSISSISSDDSFMSAIGDGTLFLPEEGPEQSLSAEVIEALGPAVQSPAEDQAADAEQFIPAFDTGPVRPIRINSLQSVRLQPKKNTDIGKGLVTYFNFKGQRDFNATKDIVQKIYFFAIQEHLLKGLLGLTYLGLSEKQSNRFLTVFEGSFFLRLQTGFSFNTSDFDIKVYPLDGNTFEYRELLEKISPVNDYISQWNTAIQFPMYDQHQNPIFDRYGKHYTIPTTNLGIYVYQTILGLVIPAITDYASTQKLKERSKTNALLQLLGELSISIINSRPKLSISQPPNPTSPLKVIVAQTIDGRVQYYAMADIVIAKLNDESIVPKVNELIARNPDERYLESVKGFKNASLSDELVDLRAIGSSHNSYIPKLVAYEVFDQVFYVPAPLYYYYEKKLLYCDIVNDKNMCRNEDMWTELGFGPFGGKNIIKENQEYFENKFRKSLKSMIYGNIPPKYQGGKQKLKAKKKTKSIQQKKRFTKRKK